MKLDPAWNPPINWKLIHFRIWNACYQLLTVDVMISIASFDSNTSDFEGLLMTGVQKKSIQKCILNSSLRCTHSYRVFEPQLSQADKHLLLIRKL